MFFFYLAICGQSIHELREMRWENKDEKRYRFEAAAIDAWEDAMRRARKRPRSRIKGQPRIAVPRSMRYH